MREILFRGKREDNGAWETGSLIIERMYTSENIVQIGDKMTAYPTPVIPETVSEYTGLTDKNGVKIFENDIVTITGFCPDDEGYGVIQWHDDEAMFVVDADYCHYDFGNISGAELEVIGNMFDNPELIGGVQK